MKSASRAAATVVTVAPFAGAWIEITEISPSCTLTMSLPSRERGLKFCLTLSNRLNIQVAPFAGAWIEISKLDKLGYDGVSRSLRGSVD